MKLFYFSRKTFLEVLSDVFANLTSGFLGALLVIPLVQIAIGQNLKSLTGNLLAVIVGLLISIYLREYSK